MAEQPDGGLPSLNDFSLPECVLEADFSLVYCSDAARALLPALAKADGAQKLLRAHPALAARLAAGEAVTLPLELRGTAPLQLFAAPRQGGYFCVLFSGASEPSLWPGVAAGLREPLTEVFALLPLLALQQQPDADPAPLARLNLCCYQLLSRTTLLSYLARLSQGSWPDPPLTDLTAAANSVVSAVQSLLLPGQPRLRAELPAAVLPVRCGGELLSTMLCALLANSLRYSREDNEITVLLRAAADRALLTVSDRGTGIRAETVGHIFEPFFSADPAGGPAPGSGLGLTFVQALAARMDGTVSAESVFGEGTRITVSLPLAAASDDAVLGGSAADYLVNRYSPVYLHLCDFCRLPELG